MTPDEILELLRLAIISGAITAQGYYGPYPAVDLTVDKDNRVLCLTWTGAELYLSPDGVECTRIL